MATNRRQLLTTVTLAALFAGVPRSMAGDVAKHARTSGSGDFPPVAPWRNWSGGQYAQPAARVVPRSEDELVALLRAGKLPKVTLNRAVLPKAMSRTAAVRKRHTSALSMRPVGAGHSFSGLVPTEGCLIVLDNLAGLIKHDAVNLTATFGAGTRLADMGAPLDAVGQGMFNLPDIDRQTIAGAISTATHGTGVAFTTLSAYVSAMRLVTSTGELLELDAGQDPLTFAAARVGLGALGVITQVTMRNRTAYRLREQDSMQPTEDVLTNFDKSVAQHRHFEMFPLVHSDFAIVQAIDETDAAINNPPETPEQAAAFDAAMQAWAAAKPKDRRALINGMASQFAPQVSIDVSHKILSNVRNTRFNEMEYSVPLANGAACLREILKTISDNAVDVVFPLEYRYVSGDDLWLSMFSGGARAAISVHQYAHIDYRPYFNLIEPIFWKYGGRPHWGKVHSLGYAQLHKLYPHLDEFLAVRKRLDPHGYLLNDYLRGLFSIGS